MIPMGDILRNIISGNDYCCLCFQTREDSCYNLYDEVSLDSERTEDLHEILTSVLGNQVLDLISTNTICWKCAENTINSYKFIMACRYNVQKMTSTIDCLQKYTANEISVTEDNKSVFLALNKDNQTISYFYDKKRNYKNKVSLSKRFKYLCRKPCIKEVCNYITVEVESLSDTGNIYSENANTTLEIPKYCAQNLSSLQISDIGVSSQNDNNYKCRNCSKTYPSKLKLKLHYVRVHAPKDFKCTKCSRTFGSSWLLNRHHKDSHCTVVCSQCGKTYKSTFSLRNHERSHKSRLVCQTCGKVYKGKQSFNHHIEQKLCAKMRNSNAEAKFSCHYCDKKYSQKPALSVHIRVEHENGRALICDWCGKKLSSISRLKDHVLKHTKQKDFNCNICGGQFVTKASLLYHTRIHTGEKPYKCDSCDMSFLSASRRSQHVKRHHAGIDLECDICHSKFKEQSCLTRHKKKHFDAKSRLYQQSSNETDKN